MVCSPTSSGGLFPVGLSINSISGAVDDSGELEFGDDAASGEVSFATATCCSTSGMLSLLVLKMSVCVFVGGVVPADLGDSGFRKSDPGEVDFDTSVSVLDWVGMGVPFRSDFGLFTFDWSEVKNSSVSGEDPVYKCELRKRVTVPFFHGVSSQATCASFASRAN